MSKKNKIQSSKGDVDKAKENELEEFEDFYESERSNVITKPLVESKSGVRIYYLFVSLLVGILGGVLGELLVNNYFASQGLELTHLAASSEQTGSNDKQVIVFKPEEVNKTDSDLQTLVETAGASVVGIFPKVQAGDEVWDSIYLPDDQLGNGLILTSDGWIVTTDKVVGGDDTDLTVVLADKNIFPVVDIITDKASGAVFLKVDAADLKVVKFGERDTWIPGEQLLVLANSLANGGLKVIVSNLEKLNYQVISKGQDLLQSTEKYSKKIVLANQVSNEFFGSPVINTSGEIVGLVYDTKNGNTVLPSDYFSDILKSVLAVQEINRPLFGATYLDLAHVLGLSSVISEGRTAGAVLYGEKKTVSAVKAGSPAEKAGLKPGDIITHVNDEPVDGRHSLTELVQDYKIGDALKLRVVFQGKEREVEVVLVGE